MDRNELEKVFSRIVETYEKTDDFSSQLCPDKYVGKIGDISGKKAYARIDDVFNTEYTQVLINDTLLKRDPVMLLILESPHISEFIGENAPCPANGTTGRNIRNLLLKLLGDTFHNHHLVLMNAIPFQCSLGGKNRKVRDKVFSESWQNEWIGEPFFMTRLQHFRNAFIVNACTQMNGLKDHVQNVILRVTGRDVLQLDHPCVQWNANFRKQKQKVDNWLNR